MASELLQAGDEVTVEIYNPNTFGRDHAKGTVMMSAAAKPMGGC